MEIISIEEAEKWDSIVKGFGNHDIYYLSDYTKAFYIHGDGIPVLFFYEEDDFKAINVAMKRDIGADKHFIGKLPKNTYFDITTPYGYGGFLLDGKINETNVDKLSNEYTQVCDKQGIISEFVRFHPVLNYCDYLNQLYNISNLGKTISMELKTPGQIWKDVTSKNRNVIRKALKSGVKIFWGRDEKLYDDFKKMYDATMDRDNAESYYYFKKPFYDSVTYDLKYNSMMFYAAYKGKTIAMSIILQANNKLNYHLSASNNSYKHLAPTNLLLYEAACWGCENGFNTFHLGGGLGSKEDNLYKFKKAFNKNSENIFSVGRKIFDKEKYNELLTIKEESATNSNHQDFFPEYRS